MDDTRLEGMINTEAYQNNRTRMKGLFNNKDLLLSSGSLSFGNNKYEKASVSHRTTAS